MKVLIIGGDRRMLFAARAFRENGYEAETLGLTENDKGVPLDADIIVLPVPATRDTVNINCALSGRKIPLDILENLPEKTPVFGGGKLGVKNYTNYLSVDSYAVKNAAITAEGAIAAAIDNTGFSLWQSEILVIGYGKTGRALAARLSGFCPKLTVSARSERDFAELKVCGIKSIETANIASAENRFDIVFNTVDIKFPEATAKRLAGALFLDISTLGGFGEGIPEKHSIEYRRLPSLPAVCAPESAGKIIAETVINLQNANGEKYA